MAAFLFLSCDFSVCWATANPVGRWVMRTAESVVFTAFFVQRFDVIFLARLQCNGNRLLGGIFVPLSGCCKAIDIGNHLGVGWVFIAAQEQLNIIIASDPEAIFASHRSKEIATDARAKVFGKVAGCFKA